MALLIKCNICKNTISPSTTPSFYEEEPVHENCIPVHTSIKDLLTKYKSHVHSGNPSNEAEILSSAQCLACFEGNYLFQFYSKDYSPILTSSLVAPTDPSYRAIIDCSLIILKNWYANTYSSQPLTATLKGIVSIHQNRFHQAVKDLLVDTIKTWTDTKPDLILTIS